MKTFKRLLTYMKFDKLKFVVGFGLMMSLHRQLLRAYLSQTSYYVCWSSMLF